MGDQVSVNPAEGLTGAARLLALSAEIEAKVKVAVEKVRAAESHPDVFPPDEFATKFKEQYAAPTESGAPVNVAVADNAVGMGAALRDIAIVVQGGMWAYSETDAAGGETLGAV